MTLLAPDIVEAILERRQPKGMQLEELSLAMLSAWEEQRMILQIPQHEGSCSAHAKTSPDAFSAFAR